MTVKQRVDLIAYNKNLNMDTKPTTCKIEISGLCTFDCVFCYHQIMKSNNIRQKMMTEDDFNIVIDKLKTIDSMKEVGLFYMGESGLHPLIAKFYKILKDNNYFTYLTTNGTVVNNIIEALPYIDSLKISWNYKNEDDFNYKTQRIGMYNTVKNNIETLYNECKNLGKEFTISTVLDSCKEDYSEVLSELKYDEHYWIPLQTQAGITNGRDGVVGEYDNMSSPIPCWSLFKGIYVDVDLNVRTCCYGHYNKNIIGNLKTQDFTTILSNKEYIKMKEMHLKGLVPNECDECLKGSR